MNKWTKIGLVFSVVVLIALGFFLYNKKHKDAASTATQNEVKISGQNYTEKASNSASTASQNTSSSENTSIGTKNTANTDETNQSATKPPATSQYTLDIPKLNINAPVSTNVDGNNMQLYLTALENGVAHMSKTALPGESGNSVIFGHSSYYKAKPGNFKTVFATLNKLMAGDTINFVSKEKTISYKVTEQKIVPPNDVSVVKQANNTSTLTLITCWPPKTTTSRMVISADLQ